MIQEAWQHKLHRGRVCSMAKLEEMQWSVVWQEHASETEGKGLQNCGQTSSVVWCRDLGNNERTRSSTRINEMKILRCMCGVTRRDTTRNDHIGRDNEDVDIPAERRRGRPNLRWKNASNRDITEVGLKEDNATNRAERRKKPISYSDNPTWRDKPGTKTAY